MLINVFLYRIHSSLEFNNILYRKFLANVSNAVVHDFGITFDWEITVYGHIEKYCCKALKTL